MTTPGAKLDALVADRNLIVCVGPGGVGKTTTAAAVAARAARAGRRALVLTVDPAKRLADALGTGALDDTIRATPEAVLRAAGISGTLSAAMLDTKIAFDAMIARISPDETARRRLLDNRIYHAISRTLARSHAYVAIERVYEITQHGGFDLVVLDTPPMRSALDILDAPSKFVRFFDDKIVRWFVPTDGSRGRSSAVVKLLGLAIGQSTAEEIAGFFEAFGALRGELNRRLDRAQAILRDAATAFVLVASPETTSLEDAAFLRDGLAQRAVGLAAVVFNRAFVPEPGENRPVDAAGSAAQPASSALADPALVALQSRLRSLRDAEVSANARRLATIESFARRLSASAMHVLVPRQETDIRELGNLLAMLDRAVSHG